MSDSKKTSETKNEMVINYVPGEECRVSVVEDGKLEEFHAERADAVSHVGNIYVGKVKNVEPAIQAAFVDFGLEQNGFLHVSDLHPQYFPGEGDETTELVGKKTPRRERPPIQECLRRGQEIAVQVLKEGVGTKGPTVTSYLSIPGRFLVMMPNMDRVGVSRKVEDEETRRKMREILDQLELPDGFGFIVRTAGMERTKAELKRDLAYLARLWKDIEKRWNKGGNKPRLLYSESDLLMRALRDMVTTDLHRIVIDDESAMLRAARFLKIVAPRTSTKLVRYTGKTPIFHAMGIEEQIRTMYSREVPLPSGGRLVIDETEALVAIDVNSGKMRDARDAETNAYRTNLEAAEEICRQLKLRDVGGIVVNDLIDMRSLKHRREIEHKFKDLLKKDRARTTLEQISQFGILEMTRQRMRGSYESVHFADCPICRGRGLVQRPDSVATDAMRELAALLEHERVARIEMAVSPRIAGELLSSKRRALNRLERSSGKHVDVRVSESVPVDRVTFYCYDDRGADIDVTRISAPRAKKDELVEYELPTAKTDEDWATDSDQEAKAAMAVEPPEPEQPVVEPVDPFLDALEQDEAMVNADNDSGDAGEERGGRGRGRRRGRRGRGRGGQEAGRDGGRQGGREGAPQVAAAPRGDEMVDEEGGNAGPEGPARAGEAGPGGQDGGEGGEGGGRRRRRRRRGRGRGRGGEQQPGMNGQNAGAAGTPIFDGDEAESEEAPMGGELPKSAEPSSWDLEVSEAERANELTAESDAAPEEDFENTGLPRDEQAAEVGDEGRDDGDDRGPAGGGDQGGAGGDGERRGRRRRRRRGRGRGRGGDRSDQPGASGSEMAESPDRPIDAEAAAAPEARNDGRSGSWDVAPSEMGEPQADREQGEGQRDEHENFEDAGQPRDAEDGDEGADDRDDVRDGEQNDTGGPEGNGDQQQGEGGGRRRRRRRRGRGRGRGGEGGGGGGGQNGGGGQPQQAQAPRESRDQRGGGQGGQRGQGGRNDRGGGEQRSRDGRDRRGGERGDGGGRQGQGYVEPRAQAPRQGSGGAGGSGGSGNQSSGSGQQSRPPQGGANSGGGPMPTPRVLYSSRRKLSPSERGKIKPE